MKNVRITVLRKQLYEDLAEEYLTDGKDVFCWRQLKMIEKRIAMGRLGV